MKLLEILPLFEARKFPELNPKLSAYEQLKQYKDNPNIFISFTEINKLGINPLSTYDTPLGIYCYPLKAVWEHYKVDQYKSLKVLPFATNQPFIQVLKWNGTGIFKDLEKYTDTNLKSDVEKIKEIYNNHPELFSKSLTSEKLIKETNSALYGWLSGYDSKKLFKILHDLTSLYPKRITKKKSYQKGDIENYQEFSYIFTSQSAKKWNKILRLLGYAGMVDYGKGIIHQNEPIQAFFTSKEFIIHLDTIHNVEDTSGIVNKDLDVRDIIKIYGNAKRPDIFKNNPHILDHINLFTITDTSLIKLLNIFDIDVTDIPTVVNKLKQYPYNYANWLTLENNDRYAIRKPSQKIMDMVLLAAKNNSEYTPDNFIKKFYYMIKKDPRWIPFIKSSKVINNKTKNDILHNQLF